MTKTEIGKRIHEQAEISEDEAESVLEQILELLKSTLQRGEEIIVTGFGKFRVRGKKARVGRNPRTGEQITIPARRVVTFHASPLLKEYVNTSEPTGAGQ
jgi:integration host factor subunit alpha